MGSEVEWINIPELARRIGLSKEAVYRLARTNSIPGMVRMGRRLVINYSFFVTASVSEGTPAGSPSSPPITPAA
jgi:predicted DNA-binding transcriptional regulator AlpA